MKRLTWFGVGTVMLAVIVSAPGCSDDSEDDGTAGTGGTAGSGGTGGSGTGGSGTGGTGTGGTGTGGTGTGGTGGSGTGGSAGAGGFDAEAFCADYGDICSFGGTNRFASADACVAAVEGFTSARQTCIQTHLGFAESQGLDPHCEHAAGMSASAATCGP